MTKFRFLLALALVCGFCGMAKADPLDFKARVQDPPPGSFTSTDITVGDAGSFTMTFGDCPAFVTGSDPSATTCAEALNDTGTTITSFDVSFVNTTNPSDPTDFTNYLNSQPATCDTSAASSLFPDATACGLDASTNTYTLDFSGGAGIAPGTTFALVMDGPDADAFDKGVTGSVTLASAPEPGSVVLLSTGVAALGFLVIRRRQDGVSLNWRA